MYEMTIFIHYVLNPVAYVLITSELPRLSTLRTRGNRKYFNVLNKVSKSTVLNVLNYLRVE